MQSFGGGTTTMTLIRRTAVDKHQWITDDQFNKNWALCQMTPGINLIALTILVGKQAAGTRGAVFALVGLLIPSAVMTALMTAGFVAISKAHAFQAVMAGVLPATIGLGFVTTLQMAKAPIIGSHKAGVGRLIFTVVLLVASAACLYKGVLSTPLILLIAGSAGAVENLIWQRVARRGEVR